MPAVNPYIIETEDISFYYGKEMVLEDVSFAVGEGDYVGLVGGNGSGKTTLLRVLLGLAQPTSGSVKLFGTPIERFHEWEKVGYVPQNVFRGDVNFPATVEEVVASGLERKRVFRLWRTDTRARDAVHRALKRAGIIHLLTKRIGELSGGERQRVFIARALAGEPLLLVLDEPTTGIDAVTEEQFYAFLEELNRSGMTIILVSHDLEAIAREVKTVLCLNHRLVCFGDPAHLRSAEVQKEMYGSGKQILHHEQEHPHHSSH